MHVIKSSMIAVLGSGNMGTAIAKVLSDNGHWVKIWNWEGDPEPLQQIIKFRENKKYLPGIKLSAQVKVCERLDNAVMDAEIVFFAVPSSVLIKTAKQTLKYLRSDVVLVDLSKGLDNKSLCLISNVLVDIVRPELKKNIVSISGPAIAGQMARKKFTVMNIAGINAVAVTRVEEALNNNYLRLVSTDDVIGIDLCGAFKNVYAIAMGITDGLGMNMNTKSAILVKAMTEMSGLVVALGGKQETVYGVAGLGDLVGTAFASESRNQMFGKYLGKGEKKDQALKKVGQTVEGIDTVKCLLKLAKRCKLIVPLAQMVDDCICGKKDVKQIFNDYLEQAFKM